jgi:hypothetical protein
VAVQQEDRMSIRFSTARFIASTIIVGACFLGPDALVAWVMG